MRPEKKFAVEELQGYIKENPCLILTDYKRVPSEKLNAVRNEMSKKDSRFQVVKNRLFKIAASSSGISGIDSLLKGQIGVIFTKEDQSIEILKYLVKYKKENEILDILGGVLDGTVYDGKALENLSKLPGKDAMRAKFVGVLQAPLSKFAQVLRARLLSLLYVINAVIEKRKGETGNVSEPAQNQQQ